MDYIYDIVLNFQTNYYDFYEWKSSDKIINVKKIPVYLTSNDDYLNLKYNEVVLENTTKGIPPKMFLVTNGLEVMGLLLDNSKKVIKRSSLLLDESDEVLEEKDTLPYIKFKYKKNINRIKKTYSRITLEKEKYLEKYFENIDINKDEYILKYIYYEIYNKEENNINVVYQELKNLIKTNISQIYNSIKKVNIELKQ